MKKEKTMHELAKEFPNKTYRELEKYREEDRQQEAGACIIGEARKDREGEEQDNPELFKTEIDYHRYWKDQYEKEHKLRQEAETETILVKGIGMNSPEMRAMKTKLSETEVVLNGTKKIVEEGFRKIQEMQKELDRVKKENNDSFNRIAELCEVNERHQEINGKLQVRLTETEEENKKMHEHLNKQVENARKSGM